MASSKLFVVLQILLISIILLAFQVAARELVETSSALNSYHKMERELVNLEDRPRSNGGRGDQGGGGHG